MPLLLLEYDTATGEQAAKQTSPSGAGTIALLDVAGTWTALQTFNQGNIRFGDTSDDHYYALGVSELSANRTITLPLLTGNDTFVFEAHAATFTNKTFDANGTGNSLSNVDVADLADGTDGELITWSSAAAPTTVAVGSANQVLTSNGAGAAPTFQAAAAGAVTALNNATANELVTVGATTTELDAEANLTFDGSTLTINADGIVNDDQLWRLGSGGDIAMVNRSTALTANTALTNVLAGTPVVAAIPANSGIISNITANGDIVLASLLGGTNSTEAFRVDTSAGLIVFNEQSADWDFRIESDGNANMLVIDGGLDSIGLGSAANGFIFLTMSSTFTSDGANNYAQKVEISGAITGASGDTNRIVGTRFANTVTTQTATENIGDIAQVLIQEPFITDNLTGDITRASTLLINGIPTEGETNAGLMIDGAASDDSYIALASSDVVTGLSTILNGDDVATDWFFSMEKQSATLGGVRLQIMAEDAALVNPFEIDVIGGTASTTKTTTSPGLMNIQISEHNGSNAFANITANGNVFAIGARVGGANATRFLVDEDGDIFVVTVVDVTATGNAVAATAFDDYDDVALIRAFDHSRLSVGLIESRWDSFVRYNEEDLIRVGVLGAPVADGGMWNLTQHTRLLNGAVWQNHMAIMDTHAALWGYEDGDIRVPGWIEEHETAHASLEDRLESVEDAQRVLRQQVVALGALPQA